MKTHTVLWPVTWALCTALLSATQATGQSTTTHVSPPALMELIKAGTNKGTDPDAGAYSLTVTNSFYMDRHEVTKALWDEVYAWAVSHGYGFSNGGAAVSTNHPVHSVNWYDCVKWCDARSEKEGRPRCYGSDLSTCDTSVPGYRLPMSEEWEYAARGGLKGKRYPWGDTIDHDKANYFGFPARFDYDKGYTGNDTRFCGGEEPYTAPVGSFPPNAYGLFDMAGNIWEWCWEWSPAAPNAHRMMRGGSWLYSADYCRAASDLNNMYPEYTSLSVGFRCVMTAAE